MPDSGVNLQKLLSRARRSRGAGFSLPIIERYEEAAAMARDIAAKLATLPWDDRAVLISDVQLLEAALKTRAEVLRAGMVTHAAEIVCLNRGAGARHAYGAGARLARTPPRGDA